MKTNTLLLLLVLCSIAYGVRIVVMENDEGGIEGRSHFSMHDFPWETSNKFNVTFSMGAENPNSGQFSFHTVNQYNTAQYIGSTLVFSPILVQENIRWTLLLNFQGQGENELKPSVRGAGSFVYRNPSMQPPTHCMMVHGGESTQGDMVFGSFAGLCLYPTNEKNITTVPDNNHTVIDKLYPASGHSFFLIQPTTASPFIGTAYIFGGWNGTAFLNDVFRIAIRNGAPILLSDIGIVTTTGTKPPPMAYHSTLVINDITRGDKAYIFGGKDGSTYYNDVYEFDITNGNTFTRHVVNGPLPPPRAGHSMIFTNTSETHFVIVGGKTTGDQLLSDIWVYDINNRRWTQQEIISSGAPPEYTRRAFHQAKRIDNNVFYIIGGIDSSGQPTSTALAVYLNENCFYCGYNNRTVCASGMDQCISLKVCPPSTPYRCEFTCQTTPKCNPTRTCGSGKIACWDGECVSNIQECSPYPSCQSGYSRCADGTCSIGCAGVTTNCSNPADTLCVDGVCRPTCMSYFGCLPDKNNYLCPDGTCSSSINECNRKQCDSSKTSCFGGCSSSCGSLPLNTEQIVSTGTFTQLGPNGKALFPIYSVADSTLPVVISSAFYNTTQFSYVYQISADPVPTSEILQIGPLPTWQKTNYRDYISSSVIKFKSYPPTMQTIIDFISGFGLFFKFEKKINEEDLNSGKAFAYYQANYCLGQAVPWYWDSSDNSSHLNETYILEYKKLVDKTLTNNITTPAYRWRCYNGTFKEAFIKYNLAWKPEEYKRGTYEDGILYYGVDFGSNIDDLNNTMAIINRNYTLVIPPEPNLYLVEHYIIVALTASTLAILVLVVLIKALTGKH